MRQPKSIVLYLFVCLLCMICSQAAAAEKPKNTSVCDKAGLILRSEPTERSKEIVSIPYGTKLKVIAIDETPDTYDGTRGYWVKVSFNQKVGWAFSGRLEGKFGPTEVAPSKQTNAGNAENRFCGKCGKKRSADENYCGKCGTQFSPNSNSAMSGKTEKTYKIEIQVGVEYKMGGFQPACNKDFVLLPIKDSSDEVFAKELEELAHVCSRISIYGDNPTTQFGLESGVEKLVGLIKTKIGATKDFQKATTDIEGKGAFENIATGNYYLVGVVPTRRAAAVWYHKIAVSNADSKILLTQDNAIFCP